MGSGMKIVNLLFVIGLCLFGIVFAVSNRQLVALSMDPFSQTDPALAINLPLFLIIAGALLLGMLIGGAVTWVGQGTVRRNLKAAKRQEKELQKKVDQAPAPAEKTGLPAIASQTAAPSTPAPIVRK